MKLTRQKALEICIELWTWLAQTGEVKENWEGWEKYGSMDNGCPFCQFASQGAEIIDVCVRCHIVESGWEGCYEMGFDEWTHAYTKRTRKKYAKIFLERLLEIK